MGICYGQLSLEERLAISRLHAGGRSIRSIAATLRRAPSTISRQVKAIDAETDDRLRAAPDLARRVDILKSIPGISSITALAILVEMPEIGQLGPKQAASLAGLAPMSRPSGAWRGKAAIRGAPATLRQALYMPALVAMRFHPELAAKYNKLLAAGKPAKVALTALMRKLIVTANASHQRRSKMAPDNGLNNTDTLTPSSPAILCDAEDRKPTSGVG